MKSFAKIVETLEKEFFYDLFLDRLEFDTWHSPSKSWDFSQTKDYTDKVTDKVKVTYKSFHIF